MRKRKTMKELNHEIDELKAMFSQRYVSSSSELPRLSTDKMMGSGVFMRLHKIGQAEPFIDVVIRDGLSHRTINAILDDLQRSYDLATMSKPSLKRLEEK
jgi:hypothetical protein